MQKKMEIVSFTGLTSNTLVSLLFFCLLAAVVFKAGDVVSVLDSIALSKGVNP